jgi:hypothetical protein
MSLVVASLDFHVDYRLGMLGVSILKSNRVVLELMGRQKSNRLDCQPLMTPA